MAIIFLGLHLSTSFLLGIYLLLILHHTEEILLLTICLLLFKIDEGPLPLLATMALSLRLVIGCSVILQFFLGGHNNRRNDFGPFKSPSRRNIQMRALDELFFIFDTKVGALALDT